ncbi:hypothetical protein EG68_05943 [Paragonimus skrjabini miyazakii]|uniref:Uncharacterized protein n=1 Tax=Paragonimus skrjabini miyazakii TaxID=59628 RepID=A0A8S9YVD5_9TREM|nr:hypothetical protein EG68_05943 [Paragonimus skrjabini miyazakii]
MQLETKLQDNDTEQTDAIRVDGTFGNMTDTEYNIVVREWLHNARLRKSLRANKGHVRTSVIILESPPEVPSTSGNL